MKSDTTTTQNGIAVEKRTRRALTEAMSVVTTTGTPLEGDETVVSVVSHSGESYDVDARDGRCTCADHEYRNMECKHIRRARVVLGRETVDAATIRALGENVDATLGASAPGPTVATADGGVVTGDGAELVDAETAPEWVGPFTEYGPRGEPTGARYVRCSACGVEVLTGETDHATHGDGCDGVDAEGQA